MDNISPVKKLMYCFSEVYSCVTSSLEMQKNPIYACLGCFIFILSSPDTHKMTELRESVVCVVVIASPGAFLIQKTVHFE